MWAKAFENLYPDVKIEVEAAGIRDRAGGAA